MAVLDEECSSAQSRSSSLAFSSTHYLAKSVLRGSVVLQVLYGHIRSPASLDVVFGKETSIELVIIGEDGVVQSVCEQAVFGIIKDLSILRWNENFRAPNAQMLGRDLLVVISDSGKLSFLTFCNEMHRFFPLTHIKLSNPGNSRNQLGRMLATDSIGCFIAASAYENSVALFCTSVSAGNDIIEKKIIYPSMEGDASVARSMQENQIRGTIWSMCFISKDPSQPSKENNPVLAILLNRKRALLNEVLLLGWNVQENSVVAISQYIEAGSLAHDIVEVPHSYGFAFLFRVGDALLMDLRDARNPCCVYRTSLNFLPGAVEVQNATEESYKVQDIDDEGLFNVAASALLELGDYDPMYIDADSGNLHPSCKRVCSWSWDPENVNNPRMIFCVDTGELFMIEISFDSDGLKVHLSACLHKGVPCKELLWVKGGFVAALVEMGDGMVLKLDNGRLIYISPIQSIAPILDMSIVDSIDEKHDQMFACCGMAPDGSLRIIRSGISVEKLLKTPPVYHGISCTWAIRMKVTDCYHSFLVLSFVEETRVLSVGLSFGDVTDSVGFLPDVCTLACGLFSDGLLIQIYKDAVRLCLPTNIAHSEGITLASPVCASWSPNNLGVSLGAVGHNFIAISTSSPCFLFILGVRLISKDNYEIYEMYRVRLLNELSCISIPHKSIEQKQLNSIIRSVNSCHMTTLADPDEVSSTFVVGTHCPSVEIFSFIPGESLRVIASVNISLMSTFGTAISGCVPQDVRLVLADRFYVLSGLRNGMLLRLELPAVSEMLASNSPSLSSLFHDRSSNQLSPDSFGPHLCDVSPSEKDKDNCPTNLQLIAVRRIGITPVFLVPLSDSLDADIIALSDRPWLLHSARHSLSYSSISFQPSTHVTAVCSPDCPNGILFVADSCLHLVEMAPSKRLNVQKFHLGGTPRKVLYHAECKLLLVMRTDISNDACASDVCCVDPFSGSVLSSYKLELGEVGKSMELVKVGNEQVLLIGTSMSSGPAIMPSGEAERFDQQFLGELVGVHHERTDPSTPGLMVLSTKGRLLVLCLERLQSSDSISMTSCSKVGPYSQRTSPFCDTAGYAAEQPSISPCSSPDEINYDGITEVWQLRLAYSTVLPGVVLAICSYLDRYFLASACNAFYVCGFPNDNPQKLRRFAIGRTRFMIMSLTSYITRIAVGDCRDGVLFYFYHEEARRLEQVYCDPSQRLVADCILTDADTAVVSDRKGSIAFLSVSDCLEESASPECNLTVNCAYYMGEIAMSIRKGSFLYKLPADDVMKGYTNPNAYIDSSRNTIVVSTLLGSIIIFQPISREEYELLQSVQAKLVVHPLTCPVLGNNHYEFRSRENPVGVPNILDGDMLNQFLELTSKQQEAVLSSPPSSLDRIKSSLKPLPSTISATHVVQLLERVHYALN